MEGATATISPSGDAVRIHIANPADRPNEVDSVESNVEPKITSSPPIDILPMSSALSRLGNFVQRQVFDPVRRQFDTVTDIGVANLHQHRFNSRELIAIIVAFCLTVTAVGLIASVGVDHSHVFVNLLSPQTRKIDVCLDYNCYKSSALMQRSMNTSVSPCDNFYQYACGGWITSQTLAADERERTVLKVMMNENIHRLKDAMLDDIDQFRETSWAYEKKVQSFYKACIDQFHSTIMSVIFNPLLDEIRRMGGWSVFGSYSRFNHSRALANVLGHDNLVDVYFYYDVEPLDQQHQYHFITIREDWLLPLPYARWSLSEMVGKYKQFIRKVGEQLANDRPVYDAGLNGRLDSFVDDVIAVEQALARIQKSNEAEIANPRAVVKTIQQLQDTEAPAFRWLYFLTACLPEASDKINLKTQVILRTPKILKATSALFTSNTFTTKQLNNYLVWRLVYARLPDLPYRYNHLWLGWSETVRGRSFQYKPIWSVCFQRAVSYMEEAVGGLFARKHFTHYDKAELRLMVETTKTAVVNQVQKLSWMDLPTKGNATEKLYEVIEKIGFPDHMDTELNMQNALDFLYQDVEVTEHDHFENSKQLRNHFRQYMAHILLNGRDPFGDWRETPLYSTKATYFYPWNEMLVPAGMLQFPIYSAVNPTMYRVQTFGATAVRLARAYIYAIDEQGSWFSKFGDYPDDWWTNNTYTMYLQLKKCYTDWYSRVKTRPIAFESDPKPRQLDDPETYVRKAIVDIGALRSAFAAYKSEVVQNDPITQKDHLVPGVKAESRDEYFFLAFAQSSCAIRSDEGIAYGMQLSNWLPEEQAVNNALAQLKEFTDIFRCPIGSPMNPPNRCPVVF